MVAAQQALKREHGSDDDSTWTALGWLMRQVIPGVRLVRYSCESCFESLWSQLDEQVTQPGCGCWTGESLDANDGDRVTVIAYDGMPEKYARPDAFPNIHLDTIFSPTVLYLLLTKKYRTASQRWIVLDPHQRTTGTAVEIAQHLHPGLQIVDGSDRSLLFALDQLSSRSFLEEDEVGKAEKLLESLFTAPGNRHAVSNLVGPVLLGFLPSDADENWVVSRLRQMLYLLNLIPRTAAEKTPPATPKVKQLTCNGSIEFVLVDDQVRNGWEQLVGSALGLESQNDVSLSSHDSAEFILQHLETMRVSGSAHRLKFGQSESRNEVLFLDLRLFEGKQLADEAKFFSRVLSVAEQLSGQFLNREELTRLKDWLTKAIEGRSASRDDEAYVDALTLLPRTLSAIDPSLPIVIFSSVGKRVIGERLRNFVNVVTDFEKPRLLCPGEDDVLAKTSRAFRSALNRALDLCQKRLISQ